MLNYIPIALNGKPVANGKFPLICAPLVGRTSPDILAELNLILQKQPHMLEWRVDFFESIADIAAVISTAKAIKIAAHGVPVLFTRRSKLEGGERITLNEDQVIDLYAAVCASQQIDLIDYELVNEAANVTRVREVAHANGVKLILSFHDFERTPNQAELVAKFTAAEKMGADVAKVAVMAKNPDDVLALLSATRQASGQVQIPVVSMSMGSYGSLTRLFGWAYGSALTFAVGARSSAPGQIPIEDLNTVLNISQKFLSPDTSPR